MTKKLSINAIKKAKNERLLTMITAYDALFATLFEESADIILVGDSLNMSFNGRADTLTATLDQMIYHTNAVCNGAKNTFVICDMPFGSYINEDEALKNAIRVYQESPADAVKIEGGKDKAKLVRTLTNNGIAVCGHIGLLPQSVRGEGGYVIRGKSPADIEALIEDAEAIEKAGAFCIVIEGVKSEASQVVSQAVNIPVIGIGGRAKVTIVSRSWKKVAIISPVEIDIDIEVIVRGVRRLPLDIEQTLFRIVQGALSNVVRHSDATKAEVHLLFDPSAFTLIVKDYGKGFDASQDATGLGIRSIRERAEALNGRLIIDSGDGEGTTITLKCIC